MDSINTNNSINNNSANTLHSFAKASSYLLYKQPSEPQDN